MTVIATTLSAHARLTVHLDKYMYKKGYNIGDAPADKDSRGKTNFRVIKRGENMAVRLHNTDIFTAYPNGDVELDCQGWANSVTTKEAMNFVLGKFHPGYINICSYKFKGNSQLCLYLPDGNGRTVRYYDGIRLSQTSEVLTPLQAFKCTRIDKAQSKALADGVKASGFKNMFAMLYATVTLQDRDRRTTSSGIDQVTNADNAESWPTIVAYAKFVGGYYNTVYENDTPAKAWTRCMGAYKHVMYETVDTETTELIHGVAK